MRLCALAVAVVVLGTAVPVAASPAKSPPPTSSATKSAAAATATLKKSRVAIGAPSKPARIARAAVELKPYTDLTRIELALDFATDDMEELEVATSLDVPEGTRITAMRIAMNGGPAISARSVGDRESRDRGVALEAPTAAARASRYTLRVAPLSFAQDIRVMLAIELPVTTELEVASAEPIAALIVTNAGTVLRAGRLAEPVKAAIPAATAESPRVRVPPVLDREHVLFASAITDEQAPTSLEVDIAQSWKAPTGRGPHVGRLELRKAFYAHIRAIEGCYPRGVRIDGIADVRFVVAPDGRATAISVDGIGSSAAKACVAAEVATWAFSTRSEVAMATLPLHVRAK